MKGIILQNIAAQRDFYHICTQGRVHKNYTREAKHTRHEDMDYKTKDGGHQPASNQPEAISVVVRGQDCPAWHAKHANMLISGSCIPMGAVCQLDS
jgi:hypothetical protein